MLTTGNNIQLFRHAQTLLEKISHCDAKGLAHALAQLHDEADRLEQVDYEYAVWREREMASIDDRDHSVLVDSLG